MPILRMFIHGWRPNTTRHIGRQLEPPGFMALNYGRRTPLITLIGQAVYGATLGGFMQVHQSAF